MAPVKVLPEHVNLFALGVLIVVISVASESFFHIFLLPKLTYLSDLHILIGSVATLFLIPLVVMVLFYYYPKQLSARLVSHQLSSSREEWERTFNTMTDYVSIHDEGYRVIKVNRALCDFLGLKAEEILGKYCYQVFHDGNAPHGNCPQKRAFESGQPVTEIITDPNLNTPLQVTCSPLFSDGGVFQGSVHVAREYETPASQEGTNSNPSRCGTCQAMKEEEKDASRTILPLCSFCKKIRDDDGDWEKVEVFIHKKLLTDISHSICPECTQEYYPKLTEPQYPY